MLHQTEDMAPLNLGPEQHVAIIGAGFSGSLLAINLLRQGGPRATLVERQLQQTGRGVAYSAAHPQHLLNVRAERMSAFPDDPDHFARWLQCTHPELGLGFAPRQIYGEYLTDLLRETIECSNGRLLVVTDDALEVRFEENGALVELASGAHIAADAVVLAPGNLPPHSPPSLAETSAANDIYVADPWAADIANGLGPNDTVLAIGSGLTMVDVAVSLSAGGFKGRMLAISRRGLCPRAHPETHLAASTLPEIPPLAPAKLLAFVRRRSKLVGWQNAVDELRPHTQTLWQTASLANRRQFLRHLRPWWDVHRHRLAPEIAQTIDAMREEGALSIRAGKILAINFKLRGAELHWRPRGADKVETCFVRRIINCSGPQDDLARTREPLLQNLVRSGQVRADSLHLGIEVNQNSETIAANGRCNPRLLALGPMTRSTFWEIVAVPDIRMQAWSLARRLCGNEPQRGTP